HVQEVVFRGVAVGHEAALEPPGAAGDARDRFGDAATGARFGGRDPHAATLARLSEHARELGDALFRHSLSPARPRYQYWYRSENPNCAYSRRAGALSAFTCR